MDIKLEPKRDRNGEETVYLEDDRGRVVACSKSPIDGLHLTRVENSDRSLSTPPTPNCLENYPAQPEHVGSR